MAKPHSREKRVVDKKVRVEKKTVKNTGTNRENGLVGLLRKVFKI